MISSLSSGSSSRRTVTLACCVHTAACLSCLTCVLKKHRVIFPSFASGVRITCRVCVVPFEKKRAFVSSRSSTLKRCGPKISVAAARDSSIKAAQGSTGISCTRWSLR